MRIQTRDKVFWSVLASPFFIIGLGFLTATAFNALIEGWAWVPLAIVYWSSMGYCIWRFKGDKPLAHWLKKSRKAPGWITITLLIGMFPLTILVMNYHLFDSVWLVVFWLLFALINPWFEEYYWRGVLLDRLLLKFPQWAAVLFTTILFMISHPLMWGVFSAANRSYHLYIFLFVAGIVWAITYLKTKSLRYVVLSHFIVDIGNLTVLTFLNIYVPPAM